MDARGHDAVPKTQIGMVKIKNINLVDDGWSRMIGTAQLRIPRKSLPFKRGCMIIKQVLYDTRREAPCEGVKGSSLITAHYIFLIEWSITAEPKPLKILRKLCTAIDLSEQSGRRGLVPVKLDSRKLLLVGLVDLTVVEKKHKIPIKCFIFIYGPYQNRM